MFFCHLMQRSGVFYFRRSVPRDLRIILPRTEIWQSLRTKERRRAELLARDLTAKTDKLFYLARLSMTEQELQTAMRRYLDDFLSGFERHRDSGSTLFEVAQTSPLDAWTWNQDFLALEKGFPLDGPITEAGLSKLVGHYERKVSYLSDCLRMRRFDDNALRVQANRLISELQINVNPPKEWYDEDRGECISEPASPDYQLLCRSLLKTQIEAYKVEIERLKGNYGNAYDRALENLISPQSTQTLSPVTTSSQATAQAHPTKQALFSEVVDLYMAEIRAEKTTLKEITFKEYEDALRLFIRIVGDKPFDQVTRDDVKAYRDTVLKLPPHINKKPETKGKSIVDIVALTEEKNWGTLSSAAVGKKFEQIKSLMKWASSGGVRLIPYDVSEGVSVPKKKTGQVRDEKKPYSKKDIAGLIRGMVEERKKGTFATHPERYWIPLIGLLSGMRQEEICQLYTRDIRQVEGVWCFDVDWLDDNDQPVKNLKTETAKRLIPIHPVLINLGLLDYLGTVKAQRHPRLWMKLNKDSRGKFSRNLKDWYNGADNRPGFENVYIDRDPKKSFHSLRHTFTNGLKQARADMLIVSEILGHKVDLLAVERYSDPFYAGARLEILRLLDYGFDFAGKLGQWSEWAENKGN